MSQLKSINFIFTIDHLTEENLNFFGWYEVDRKDSIAVYRRMHDGHEQYVVDGPPRYFCVDDYNDAQSMSNGTIVTGPEGDSDDC